MSKENSVSGKSGRGKDLWRSSAPEDVAERMRVVREARQKRTPGPKSKSPIPRCPPALRHVARAWETLARRCGRDPDAARRLIELATRYADDAPPRPDALSAGAYAGLPVAAARLAYALDADIAGTVRRYERGLPCDDVEAALAECLLALRDAATGAPERGATTRWRAVVVEAVRAAARRGNLRGQPAPGEPRDPAITPHPDADPDRL